MTRNRDWFKTIRSKTLAAERKAVHDRDDFEGYFRDFRYALQEFGIIQDGIYNLDEIGLRIGCLNGRIAMRHANNKAVYDELGKLSVKTC
jgi:hypothetical protein